MKAVILAGGYAKRLWPLTKDKPKPLLRIAGRAIIEYVLKEIETTTDIDEIIISTNSKFEDKFREWLKKYKSNKKVKLIAEPTMAEGEKLGSVGALGFLIKKIRLDEDMLIIGGDNIFEFKLKDFIGFIKKKQSSGLAFYDIKYKEKVKERYGIGVLDKNKIMIDFQEKPEKPKSSLVSTACYLFIKKDINLINKYLEEGNNPDAMGFFISWLYKKEKVYGFVFDQPWFDIGSFESLEQANNYFSTRFK
jgi:glucose-1-phosphate thymidylyltransferase